MRVIKGGMRSTVVLAGVAAVIVTILLLGADDQLGPNPYVIIGISSGATYGLVALGLVLVYKGTRVFNFAQGEFGTMAAFIAYVLLEQVKSVEISYGVAALIAIVATVGIGLVMERTVIRPLLEAPRVTVLVATIAFALLLVGVQILLFLPEAKSLPAAIDSERYQGIELFLYTLTPQELLIMGLLAALGVVLAWFFSRTDLGLAVLATSQDEFATRVMGIGTERMSRFIWGSAAFLGAVAGILYLPTQTLAPAAMTTSVLIASFTGAVIGGMTSFPGAFLGGVLVGLVEQLTLWASSTFYLDDRLYQDILPGTDKVALVIVLLVVLLIRPQGLLGSET